jgi:hypothetical protein
MFCWVEKELGKNDGQSFLKMMIWKWLYSCECNKPWKN